jgi:release factor glutamine methyltransferase
VTASDVSDAALAIAAENARRLGADVRFVAGDGLAPLAAHAPFDWIVCNPPYIDPEDAPGLPREVREHEPALALFAPRGDPDFWVRALLAQGLPLVRPGGGFLIELGLGQAARLGALLSGVRHALHADLAGIPRVLEVRAVEGSNAPGL